MADDLAERAGRNRGAGATAAIATFGMLAAPTAFGIANAGNGADLAEVSCVRVAHVDVERRLDGEADIAASLVRDDQVTVLGRKDDKTRIRYPFDGRKRVGWVNTAALGACSGQDNPPVRPPTHPHSDSPGRRPVSGISFSAPPGPNEMRAHFINVGQGASTLYEFSCGAALVDTGAEFDPDNPSGFDGRRELTAYLDAFFARRPDLDRTLDLLVVSHPHEDHAAGADRVTSRYKIKNVLTDGLRKPEGEKPYSGGPEQEALEAWAKANAKLEIIKVADIPKGGKTDATIDPIACPGHDPKLRVLWGGVDPHPDNWSDTKFKDANNHSIALRVDLGSASFLTTGDLTNLAVPDILALHGDSGALDVDVWEVSHHGSDKATNEDILHAITPQIALLGTGDTTDPSRHTQWTAFGYGHPRQAVVDLLFGELTRKRTEIQAPVALGVHNFQDITIDEAIYATGWDGTVVVSAKADGTYEVATER